MDAASGTAAVLRNFLLGRLINLEELRRTGPLEATLSFLQAVGAEFIGTFMLVFVGTGSITSGCHLQDSLITSDNTGDEQLLKAAVGSCVLQSPNVLTVSLAFGFGVFAAVYCTAAVSGGHVNPAVTLGSFLAGRTSLLRALAYAGSQCLGAFSASEAVRGVDSHGFWAAGGGANVANRRRDMTPLRSWGLETVLTFFLVLTVLSATDPNRAGDSSHLSVLAPLATGMIVFVSHLLAVPLDGASLNPARSFGPAAVAHSWEHHWVFWAGPCCGAAAAVVVFQLLFRRWTLAVRSLASVASAQRRSTDAGLDADAATSGDAKSDILLSAHDLPHAEYRITAVDSQLLGSVVDEQPPPPSTPRFRLRSERCFMRPGGRSKEPPVPRSSQSGGRHYVSWPEVRTIEIGRGGEGVQ